MESIKEIFRIGYGPSSSHTMGPRKAVGRFRDEHPEAAQYIVHLFGSLAATGKGHLTDMAIIDELSPKECTIEWAPKTFLPFHPNALKITALDKEKAITAEKTFYSVGGGKIIEEGEISKEKHIYPLNTMADILIWSGDNGRMLWEYVVENEESDIWDYLNEAWKVMQTAVEEGLEAEGVLPGGLNLARKASRYQVRALGYRSSLKRRGLAFAYALAVAEQNASGGKVVTAPTCGSAGVLPGLMYTLKNHYKGFGDKKILRALATAGLVGNLVKQNASISGAEVGCQGEIGTACAMAAAAANQMFGGTAFQIEYAASMGLEHFLGLTCDPIKGLVQIPCIERNAFAVTRALDANLYSALSDGKHHVHFDKVVKVMNQTGHDLPNIYKETSEGGLALFM